MQADVVQELVCPTVLLGDTPSDIDAFRHLHVAKAIAGMILNEDGGRAIALTGPWGSGKSTVVSLLAIELAKSTASTKVITFDAWAHQGDPLRRTFLELAISELGEFIDDEKWTRHKSILSRRLVETETRTKPELTTAGALGALALLISPVGFQLFATLTKGNQTTIPWQFWIPFLLGSAPLIVGSYVALSWLRSYMQRNPKPMAELIYSAAESKTTTSSSRTAEPTSVEFETAYCDLLRDAISGEARKVVIVIDNLDRLENADAKIIWSTLRTFFDPPLRREDWFRKTWILVPFDDQAMDSKGSTSTEPKTSGKNPFIEKTFQAFFRVPPALLTDWESYLIEQLKAALPGHCASEEFHAIFRIYDGLREVSADPPTPRQLKLFVNKVGALHRQWQHEISIVTQATFILLLEKNGDGFRASLQNSNKNDFLAESISRRLASDWQRDLAALYFNVLPEAALEALLAVPIANALASIESGALALLEDSPGFVEVLQKTLDRQYPSSASTDQSTLPYAILGLSRLIRKTPEYAFSRDLLYDRTIAISKWNRPDSILGAALASIYVQNPRGSIERLLVSLEGSLNQGPEGGLEGRLVAGWCEAAFRFLEVIPNLRETKFPGIKVKSGATEYLTVLETCLRDTGLKSTISHLRPDEGPKQVVSELCSRAETLEWRALDEEVIDALMGQQIDRWDWQPLATRLARNLGEAKPEPASCGRIILSLSKIFHAIDPTGLPELLNSSSALNNYFSCTTSALAEPSKEALALFEVLLICSSLSLEMEVPDHTAGYNYRYQQQIQALSEEATKSNEARASLLKILQATGDVDSGNLVLNIAKDYFTATKWREVCTRQSDRKPFVVRIVDAAKAQMGKNFFSISELLHSIEFWWEILGEEKYLTILKSVSGGNALSDWLKERPYDARFDGIYQFVLAQEPDEQINRIVTEAFRVITCDDWRDHFSQNPNKLKLLAVLSRPELGAELGDALYDFSTEEIGNNRSSIVVDGPALYLKAMDTAVREHFHSRLASWFAADSGAYGEALEAWGEILADSVHAVGVERSRERLMETLERADGSELTWVIELLRRQVPSNSNAFKLIADLKAETRRLLMNSKDRHVLHRLNQFANSLRWKFRLPDLE